MCNSQLLLPVYNLVLLTLFRILGTPTNAIWPGVQELPDFKPNFPQWAGKPLIQVVPKLGAQGCDVLEVRMRSFMKVENLY